MSGKEMNYYAVADPIYECDADYDYVSESDEQDTDGSDEDLNGAVAVSGSAF